MNSCSLACGQCYHSVISNVFEWRLFVFEHGHSMESEHCGPRFSCHRYSRSRDLKGRVAALRTTPTLDSQRVSFPTPMKTSRGHPRTLLVRFVSAHFRIGFCSLEWFLDVFSFSFSALVVLVLLVFLLNETGCRTMSSPWSAQDSREYAARRFGRSGKQLCLTKRQSCSWQSWTSLRL